MWYYTKPHIQGNLINFPESKLWLCITHTPLSLASWIRSKGFSLEFKPFCDPWIPWSSWAFSPNMSYPFPWPCTQYFLCLEHSLLWSGPFQTVPPLHASYYMKSLLSLNKCHISIHKTFTDFFVLVICPSTVAVHAHPLCEDHKLL